MGVNGFAVHGAVCLAVLGSGIGAAVAGSGASGVTLADPQVLRLIQNAPAALDSYAAISLSGTFTISVNSHTVTESLSADASRDGRTGTFTVTPSVGPRIHIDIVDRRVYAVAPPSVAATTGRQWLSCQPVVPASVQPTATKDALAFLRLMPGASGPVHQVGHGRVDGVPATHYRVDIDVVRAAQQEQADGTASVTAQQVQQLQAAGITTIPFDVWLDAQHAVRRFSFAVRSSAFTMHVDFRVHGSNEVPQVTAPPAAAVAFVAPCQTLFTQLAGR